MSFFFLLPMFWLSGILLYASSSRQQFLKSQRFCPPRWLALLVIGLLSLITLYLLTQAQFTVPLALIFILLGLMFFIPAPVFLLNHKPNWAISSMVVVSLLAALFQFLGDL